MIDIGSNTAIALCLGVIAALAIQALIARNARKQFTRIKKQRVEAIVELMLGTDHIAPDWVKNDPATRAFLVSRIAFCQECNSWVWREELKEERGEIDGYCLRCDEDDWRYAEIEREFGEV